jgi:acid phosphatase
VLRSRAPSLTAAAAFGLAAVSILVAACSSATTPSGAGSSTIPRGNSGAGQSGGSGTSGTVAAAAGPARCGTLTTAPTIKHVVLIMEENHSYNAIIGVGTGAPYINSLARSCGIATAYHNITHPSLPNYIAITSATTLTGLGAFESDCDPGGACLSHSQNLFSQLGPSGWKAYDESMPSPCDATDADPYAARHNPALYYTDIPANTCSANDLPLGTLSSSPFLNAFSSESTAPKLTVVTPNLNHDMHNGTVAQGDSWLRSWLTMFTATTVYKSGDTVVFIIWDEGGEVGSYAAGEECANSADVSCHVPALVVAPSVKAVSVSTPFTHYSFVRTVEDIFGLPPIGQAGTATSMAAPFKL